MATEGGESTDSLRREVEAMVCPICMELMNKPVTLAPCGHALCSHCATAHIKQHCQNKCPVCRSRIASTARNLQLASILHSYACEQEPSSDPSLDPLRMRSKLMGVEAREKHLSSELPRVRSEELDATSKLRSAEVALSCLRNDEADAVSKVEQAQKMLALVREQVRWQLSQLPCVLRSDRRVLPWNIFL
jgi:hypothetical protein